MKKKIYCIHSGIQHILQPALAFQICGMLEKLISSYLIDEKKAQFLEKINNKKFQKNLLLRRLGEVEPDKIINIPKYELFEIFVRFFLGRNQFTFNRLPHWRDERFAKRVIRHIDPCCSGIFGFPNNVLESFQHVSISTLKVVEQPIGHNKAAASLFKEEIELNPEFADSITFNNTDHRYIERIDEELRLANIVCVPSEFVKRTLMENNVDECKIRINQYGSFLDPVSKCVFNQTQPLTIIFVGQLSQRKGLKYLLEAMKKLKNSRMQVKLVLVGQIIGSGSWMKNYADYIDEYHPSVPRHELKKLFQKSDVFILPSLFEGSALVTYEALSHAVPCIVTPNTGSDFIRDYENGFVIPIRCVESIIEKISFLDRNRDVLDQMKIRSLECSHGLSWGNYRARLKEIVDNEINKTI